MICHQVSPGDTGWDVFSLDYHVDGPIRTVSLSSLLLPLYISCLCFKWNVAKYGEFLKYYIDEDLYAKVVKTSYTD